jgi:hypothetical protein
MLLISIAIVWAGLVTMLLSILRIAALADRQRKSQRRSMEDFDRSLELLELQELIKSL